MPPSDDFDSFSQSNFFIENSKPKKDCKFCHIKNYENSHTQYAVCVCPALCKGLVSVDISSRTMPLQFIYSCRNCKHYTSDFQLTIFYYD